MRRPVCTVLAIVATFATVGAIAGGGPLVTLYQPQVERWSGDRLDARAAIAVRASAAAAPSYAVVSFSARAAVDKPDGVALLEDVTMRGGLTSLSASEEALVRQWIPAAVRPETLDRLQASLAASDDEPELPTTRVRNDPPAIIVTTRPALLVAIDGAPALRRIGGTRLERVINTRALVVRDPVHHRYYLYLGDCWMSAPRLAGPWTQAVVATPPALERVRRALAAGGLVDLFDDKRGPVRRSMETGTVPRIIVRTTPAELVELRGAPRLEPVVGTRLLSVANSDAALFRRQAERDYFLLLSGRWYRSTTLVGGDWSFVAAPPKELADVPASHPKAWILASLPGTREANDAALAHVVPQTATVRRGPVEATIAYDGEPELLTIDGTALRYAANSATPVVRAGADEWYALVDGVWLSCDGPYGPWQVATALPDAIYAIPPSSKLHHVTYARIYGAAPDVVYVGYLAGYLGSYVSDVGTVVYGTGYEYDGWRGRSWIAPPRTFGAGMRWSLAAAGFVAAHARTDLDHRDVYAAWPAGLVRDDWQRARHAPPGAVANDVYAGRDGWVYRHDGDGWERFADEGWHPAGPGTLSASLTSGARPGTLGELERERQARRRIR